MAAPRVPESEGPERSPLLAGSRVPAAEDAKQVGSKEQGAP
jgi:hypothetical protein